MALALATIAVAGCDSAGFGALAAPAQKADDLIKLPDARQFNMRCTGRGSPTVLLESGFAATLRAWTKVQPQLSRITRVCAYDRAALGFSDPGPLPRDGAAMARDLDQALDAAGVAGPYVVVGHSAGGLYARLFAARRPSEVQGLVLLDPTVEHFARPGADGLDGLRRRRQRCQATAELSPQPPDDDPRWTGCWPARASARDLALAHNPAVWRNQVSELDSLFSRTSEEIARLGDLLHDVPVYVITASDTAAGSPTVGYDKPQSIWELQHVRLALSFQHGAQRTVLSSHQIMIDRPEVVIEAVTAMVEAARAGKPPPGLAVSETQPATEEAFPEDPAATK